MKIISHLQNTPEWEAFRKNRIGASDANIIMGQSEYCTIRELWKQKALGEKREEGNTFAQDKGHRLEIKNRATLEIEYGVDFPAITGLSDHYEWLMSSFDGVATIEKVWSEENNCWVEDPHLVLAEFKYCGQDSFDLVESGIPIPQYRPQIQTQLVVSGARYLILGVTTEDKVAIAAEIERLKAANLWDEEKSKKPQIFKYARCTVYPDLEYMEKELLPSLVKFQESVINKTDPGYGPKDEKDESDNVKLADTLDRLKRMLKDQVEISDLISKTEKEVYKLTTHTRSVCNGVEIRESQRAASKTTVYDFEKFLLDEKLTLPDSYISIKTSAIPKPTKTIKFPKEETAKEDKTAEEMIVPGASIKLSEEERKAANDKNVQDRIAAAHLKFGKPEEKPKRTRRTKAQIEEDKNKGLK